MVLCTLGQQIIDGYLLLSRANEPRKADAAVHCAAKRSANRKVVDCPLRAMLLLFRLDSIYIGSRLKR